MAPKRKPLDPPRRSLWERTQGRLWILIALRAALGVASAILLIAGLTVHASSFGSWRLAESLAWSPGLFLPAISLLALCGADARAFRRSSRWADYPLAWDRRPKWLQLAERALFAYAIANFIACAALLGGGHPIERGGALYYKRGSMERPISEPEYHRLQRIVGRLATGHYALFGLFSASHFLWAARSGIRWAKAK